ncbi:hypothetical protein ACWGQT_36965, partial [Streptomyces yangpuensis]
LVLVAGSAAEIIPMPVIGGLILVIGAELVGPGPVPARAPARFRRGHRPGAGPAPPRAPARRPARPSPAPTPPGEHIGGECSTGGVGEPLVTRAA